VKAARKWASEYGRAVNAKNPKYKPWLATMTTATAKRSAGYMKSDLGTTYPGPLPFTPVKVTGSGGTAKVMTCMQFEGWATDPKTKQPVSKVKISPAVFDLTRAGSSWQMSSLYDGEGYSCSKVKVVGRAW